MKTRHKDNYFLENAFDQLQIIGKTGDPSFFMFVVVIKYIFLISSVISGIIYFKNYSSIRHNIRVWEQEALLSLSILVAGFNDPFYPITLLFPNSLSIFFSIVTTSSFYSYLLYFWLVLFQRFYQDNSLKPCTTNHMWKKILGGTIFTITTIMNHLHSNLYRYDPSFQIKPQVEWYYYSFLAFMDSFQFMIIAIIMYFSFRVYKDWAIIIQRHKVSCLFSFYFIVIITMFIVTANNEVYYENGERALLIISMSNIYVGFMQYLYSPTHEGLREMANITELKKMEMNAKYFLDEGGMEVLDYRDRDSGRKDELDDDQLVPDK